MFEDATFESEGRIRTRSRRWMVATLIFNAIILLALILIPLIYPEGLPRQAMAFLLTTPPPPSPPELPKKEVHPFHGTSEMNGATLMAPPSIPRFISNDNGPEQAPGNPLMSMDSPAGMPDGGTGVFTGRRAVTVVHAEPKGPVPVSSGVMVGDLIYKLTPSYPAIAREAHVEGTVVLQAMISKAGTIETLRVISGPVMLQQPALDAVKAWRYRPYLLNGQPVEVETTVNVVFKLGS